MSLPTKLLIAAMASSQHVFVDWMPHVNGIRVYAHPSDTTYCEGSDDRIYLMNKTVYLDWDDADEKLAEILETVEALG